jgi:hypothetical protein
MVDNELVRLYVWANGLLFILFLSPQTYEIILVKHEAEMLQ